MLQHILNPTAFLIQDALTSAGIPVRHIEENTNVPMYVTKCQCTPSGVFKGPLVVSMRPMTHAQAIAAVQITSLYGKSHGAPLHIGDPAVLGIENIDEPDFGNKVTIQDGEVPVFWACGVTTQLAVMNANPELAITHSPGHMFVSDMKSASVEFPELTAVRR